MILAYAIADSAEVGNAAKLAKHIKQLETCCYPLEKVIVKKADLEGIILSVSFPNEETYVLLAKPCFDGTIAVTSTKKNGHAQEACHLVFIALNSKAIS